MNIRGFLASTVFLFFSLLSSGYAGVLQFNTEGYAVGITGMDVEGSLYDVTFEEGTFNEVYGTSPVFPFPSNSEANKAFDAIVAVVISSFSGPYLDWMGASGTGDRLILPYELSGTERFSGHWSGTSSSNFSDSATVNAPRSWTGGSSYDVVFAVFSPAAATAAVPEPATFALLGIGLLGMRMRKK